MQFIRYLDNEQVWDNLSICYFNRQKRDDAMGFLIRRLVDTPDHASGRAHGGKCHKSLSAIGSRYAHQISDFFKNVEVAPAT